MESRMYLALCKSRHCERLKRARRSFPVCHSVLACPAEALAKASVGGNLIPSLRGVCDAAIYLSGPNSTIWAPKPISQINHFHHMSHSELKINFPIKPRSAQMVPFEPIYPKTLYPLFARIRGIVSKK